MNYAKVLRMVLVLLSIVACSVSQPPITPSTKPPTTPTAPLPDLSPEPPGLQPIAVQPVVTAAPIAPDMTGFTPTVTAVADGAWENRSTWDARVPTAWDIVSIPQGRRVSLASATAALNGLWILGSLEFADANVAITSAFILVYGKLQAGTETQPYNKQATITLTGANSDVSLQGMGTKVLGVPSGGLLKLHGQRRLAWSQLSSDANIGSTSLSLDQDPSTWKNGDQIVLASSGFDPREAEVVTVNGVSGKTVSFSPALKYAHLGLLQTYNNKKLDERAAVGLLSRNIVVRGDDTSSASKFGGHIMVMGGGNAQVSGIELLRMGQAGRKGRYPMHWHLGGDHDGNYLMNSAIHDSLQRAAVIHSTNNVLLEGNVAYNIPNHAFVWSEDGNERGNKLIRNLAVLGRNPDVFAFPFDAPLFGNSEQGEQRSGLFWGRSVDHHIIRGNIAAGMLDGNGFFIDFFSPAPYKDIPASGFVFDGNIAHSIMLSFGIGNQVNYPEATKGHGLMVSGGTFGSEQIVLRNYTGYHNGTSAWIEDRSSRLENSIVADNRAAGVLLLRGAVKDITVVGKSANPVPVDYYSVSVTINELAGIQVSGSDHGALKAPKIESATMIDLPGVGVLWDQPYLPPEAEIGKINFINTKQRVAVLSPDRSVFFYNYPTFGTDDRNGTFVGDGKAVRIVEIDSNLLEPSCIANNQGFYTCPLEHSFLLKAKDEISLVEPSGRVTNLRHYRYDDPQMPEDMAQSYVGINRRYKVQTASRSQLEFQLFDAIGKSIELNLSSSSVTSIQLSGQNLAAAASLSALRSGTGSGYFFDAANQQLYVRVRGSSALDTLNIQANMLESNAGRPADTLPSNAVNGFSYAVYNNNTDYQYQYQLPTGMPVKSGQIASTQIDTSTSQTALQTTAGQTSVMRGYVYAPSDGKYKLGVWGSGGGTSAYIGDTWIMGEPFAFLNGNYQLPNNQWTTDFIAFQPNGEIALQKGWHTFSVVHAKIPTNNAGNAVMLRWIVPDQDKWVYPEIKTAP